MAVQFVRGDERFSIEYEIGYGLPGASAAFDQVTVAITRGGRTKRARYKTIEAAAHRDGFVFEVDGVSMPSAPATFTPVPELEALVDDHPGQPLGRPRGCSVRGL